ncbi:MAG TPA: hypothetical protein VGD94_03545 [Vicinamibacterales bacterium]
MRYSTPELVVVGAASVLVLGGDVGGFDNPNSQTSRPMTGVALGLD